MTRPPSRGAGRGPALLALLALLPGPGPARARPGDAADVFDLSAWLAVTKLEGPFALTASGGDAVLAGTFAGATEAMGVPMGGKGGGGSISVKGTFNVTSMVRSSDPRMVGTLIYQGPMRGTATGNATASDFSKGAPPRTRTIPCSGPFEGTLTIELQLRSYQAQPVPPTITVEYSGRTACGGDSALGASGSNLLDAGGRAAVVPAPGKPDRLQATIPVYAHISVAGPAMGDLVDGAGTFTLGVVPDKQVEVRIDGPSCVCSTSGPQAITLRARATKAEATFQRFLVEPEGKPPVTMQTGGPSPMLHVSGDGETAGRTKVTAVYSYRGKTLTSDPHVVDFATLRKPKLPATPWTLSREMPGGDGAPRPYLFDQAPHGHVEIDASVEAFYDGAPEKQLTWDVAPEGGAGFAPRDPGPDLRKVTLVGKLPEAVAGLGRHDVVARLERGGCACASEPRPVALFFPRDAQNLDGQRPNWAIYWPQTSAGTGAPFRVVKVMPQAVQKGGFPCSEAWRPVPPDPQAVARYEQRLGTILILENFTTMAQACVSRPAVGAVDFGIDCFAVLLRHENMHRTELDGWWGPGAERYRCDEDRDGDMVPDEVEKRFGCDPLHQKSCPTRPAGLDVTDIELDAYQVGWTWAPGSADREDWACPGKQCPGYPDH